MKLRLAALGLAVCIVAGCGGGGPAASKPTSSVAPHASITPSPRATAKPRSTPLSAVRSNDIAYVRARHIWLAHADGADPIQLTFGPGLDYGPAWSPDRRHIAFIHEANDASDSTLTVLNPSDGTTTTWPVHFQALGLCYSPSGGRIALTGLQFTSPLRERVAILDPTSGETRVVRWLHDQFTTGLSVSWSPDGRRLLLGLARQDEEGQRTGVLTLASDKLVWLKIPDACEAHWSPDGRSIVVNQATQQYSDIAIAGSDGTIRGVLVRGSGWGGDGPWVMGGCYSSDGSRIAFWNSSGSIWTMSLSGGGKRRLVVGADPAWSVR